MSFLRRRASQLAEELDAAYTKIEDLEQQLEQKTRLANIHRQYAYLAFRELGRPYPEVESADSKG